MQAVYREIEELGFTDDVYSHAKLVNHALMTFLKEISPFLCAFTRYL